MPQLSRAQLLELSQVPRTMFFIWQESPVSRYYHMMITTEGRCLALHPGWELYDSFTITLTEIARRYVLCGSWMSVPREQFCAVMEGRDGAFHGKSDPRLKTNHKLGAPKGKLP